jgi:hypothetical protein
MAILKKYGVDPTAKKPAPIKPKKGTKVVVHTDKNKYEEALAAQLDSAKFYNDAKNDFNKFNKIGDLFNTNLSPEKWQKANKEYDRLLNSQEKKWHTFPYKNGDVSKYIPGYTENYKYKGPRSGLIIQPVGKEKFYREGYDFPRFKEPVIHNVYEGPSNESISALPLRPIPGFATPEQTIILGKQQIKPFEYKYRDWKPAVYKGKNLEMKEGYTQADVEKKIRQLQEEEFQRKNFEYKNKTKK